MRQTVIGLFNTYAEADGARNALVQSGFAYNEVELRANPETASDAIADESPGVLANIERFFTSLFSTSGSSLDEPIAERYTDAVRRGAVLVAVDAASDAHTELAHNLLMRLGAHDVSERARIDQPPRDAGQAAQVRREHSMLDELGLGAPAATPTAAQPPNEALRAMEEERRYERIDAPPHDTPLDGEAARTAIAEGGVPGSGAVLRPDLADTGRRELDEAAMREARLRERDVPATPLAPSSQEQFAPPRDEFSRTSGEAPSTAGDESAYPARTVRGAAQYHSDPADISRATPLPGEGLWQRQAAESVSEPVDMTPRAPEPRNTPNVRGDAQTGAGSEFPSAGAGLGGTAGMTNEHDARQQLRGDDYSPPTVATRSAANQQAVRRAGDGDLGAPIPDEFLEYEEDFRLHYDEQFGAREGARYDEYVPAYRYGATMGRDARYQDRPWDDDVELEARHDWERAAPEGSWDRFKAAVRHGWERVTGHHHH